MVINVLNTQMKGVTTLTSRVESADDEYLGVHNTIQPCVILFLVDKKVYRVLLIMEIWEIWVIVLYPLSN